MHVFDLLHVLDARRRAGRPYLEFLRVPDLSAGVYRLPKGGTDPQGPHAEDEVYYVLNGRATLEVADEAKPVAPGTLAYVPKGVPHRFTRIEEDLEVLVLFAPAESAPSGGAGQATTTEDFKSSPG